MEKYHQSYHQTILEKRLTPLPDRIQHASGKGSRKSTNKIRLAMHSPRMDHNHTPRYNHPQSLSQTRNNQQQRAEHNANA
jgi:hypothetical protein